MSMSSQIEVQQQRIASLLKLAEENPNLRIVPMVDTEVVGGDDHGWWTAVWGAPSIEEIFSDEETVYIRSEDEERLIDEAYDNIEANDFWSNGQFLSDAEAEEAAKRIVANYGWEKVIAVKIHTQ